MEAAAVGCYVPTPPPRNGDSAKYTVDFDINVILAKRAQRMLAAGNATAISPSKPVTSSVTASPKKAVQGRYPLEWNPRAIPLIEFAEQEARNIAVKIEAEYRTSMTATIHYTLVVSHFRKLLEDLENDAERRERQSIAQTEFKSRERLWQGHEELRIAQQLKSIDVSSESLNDYFTPVQAAVRSIEQIAAVHAETLDKRLRREEWVMGITSLVTWGLGVDERNARLQMLQDEFNTRKAIETLFLSGFHRTESMVNTRKHSERCQAYREARYMQVSTQYLSDYFGGFVFQEWMLVSSTMYAAALLDEQRVYLCHLSHAMHRHAQHDEMRRLIKRERWHRNDAQDEFLSKVWALETTAFFTDGLLCIASEEDRIWQTTFAPFVKDHKRLASHCSRRQGSALRIQIMWRLIRQSLRGWRATHRRLGEEIRSQRRSREFVAARREAKELIASLNSQLQSLSAA